MYGKTTLFLLLLSRLLSTLYAFTHTIKKRLLLSYTLDVSTRWSELWFNKIF